MDQGSENLRHRALAWILALAIALASLGHAAHSHAKADAPAKSPACAYCTTFERGHAPPPAVPAVVVVVAGEQVAGVVRAILEPQARHRLPPARAPPRRIA